MTARRPLVVVAGATKEMPSGDSSAVSSAGLVETTGPTDLALGSVLDGDTPRRVSSALAGRISKVLFQSSNVTEATLTTPIDIPGLSLTLPRAGTYQFRLRLNANTNNGVTTAGFGVAFSGTTTKLIADVWMGTPSSFAFFGTQTVSGTLVAATRNSTALNSWIIDGHITVSTSGTFKFQFSRSANSYTIQDGSGLILEL